jgi:hypothetical protein
MANEAVSKPEENDERHCNVKEHQKKSKFYIGCLSKSFLQQKNDVITTEEK